MVANNELVTGAFVNQQTYPGGLTLYRCYIYLFIMSMFPDENRQGWGWTLNPYCSWCQTSPNTKKTGLTWSKHIKTIQNRYKWMEMDGTKNEKQKKSKERINQGFWSQETPLCHCAPPKRPFGASLPSSGRTWSKMLGFLLTWRNARFMEKWREIPSEKLWISIDVRPPRYVCWLTKAPVT